MFWAMLRPENVGPSEGPTSSGEELPQVSTKLAFRIQCLQAIVTSHILIRIISLQLWNTSLHTATVCIRELARKSSAKRTLGIEQCVGGQDDVCSVR